MSGKLFLSLMVSVALAIPAAADFSIDLDSTDSVEQLSLPRNLSVNQTQSNTYIRIFAEKQGVELASDLAVDTLGVDGTYRIPTDLVAGSIDAGTLVNSYLIHVDPVDYPGGLRTYPTSSITFGDSILGLMVTRSGLEATDYLLGGAPGTTYWWTSVGSANVANRGLELNGQDFFTISGNTLTLNLKAAEAIDNIRVIEAVPVPAAVLLGMLGLGAAGLRLRKYV